MPPSSRNVNLQHGSNAHRRRIRHQTARSTSTEKGSETERRGSKSEDAKMTNGSSAGNRFAALAHTEPAPGTNTERGLQTKQADFTFRCERPFPIAAGTTIASEARQPSRTQAKAQVLISQPVAFPSPRKESDLVLTPTLLAEPRVTALLQDPGDPQTPPTPPHTPPSEASSMFAQSSIHTSPPAVSTESLSPNFIDVHSTSSSRALQPQTEAVQTFQPSSSPPMIDLPLQPPRILVLPKPKVHLPPTMDKAPNPQTTTLRTLFSDSGPLAHTLTSAKDPLVAMAAKTVPTTTKETLEAIPKPAERVESKRASSERSQQSSVDEVSEDSSDGEWELVG